MKRRSVWERLVFNISRFLSFYLVIALVTSTVMMLFLKGVELDEAMVRHNAPETFVWTILMALVGCGIDALRRHMTVDRPLSQIIIALERIGKGDFEHRLDVTHRDFSQLGFRDICEGINRLAGELEGVETMKTDFIANVSHELKTPLAAVRNYATLLREPDLPESQRQEYVGAIKDITTHLAEMVSNILKLNKLENQQIFPEVRQFELGEQIARCLLNFENAWEEKELELSCDIADEVMVEADPELLELVWNNLFSNAVKFTPQGGRIGVTLTVDGGWAVVSVTDTGCGMTPETGRHIFEKFYQGDTAHATRGNGLGLALVKRVVDITGGAITVSSRLGQGSTFTVRLGRIWHGAA